MRRYWAALYILFLCAVIAGCGHAELAPTETVAVAMTDGTKLTTDVYLPKRKGPWPVMVTRSTYGRKMPAESMVRKGYAVVVQDVRGRGDSEGEKFVFNADGWRPGLTDGADTIAWVKRQPWCNGKIGTCGGSALGITQMLMAPATRDVAAQAVDVAASNHYEDFAFVGGVFRKSMLEGWLTAIQEPHLIPVYKSHPTDDDWWSYYDIVAKAPDITAPAFFTSGWYDIFQQGAINGFVSREQNGGEGAKGNCYLVMSWSPHGPDVTKDYKLNKNRFDLKISQLKDRFMSRYLKGDMDAMKGVAKVNYYTFGSDAVGAPGNEWRTAEGWPPFPTTPTSYYLLDSGALATDTPAAENASRSFVFDPKNPVATCGGAELVLPSGPFDQRAVTSTRNDILHFASEPLAAPLEITGRVAVHLYVSSDAPDTDFTVKLMDIYPAGDDRQILMLDSIRRVKTRLGYDTVAPLLTGPQDIVKIDIDLQSISWIFDKGHRIGLDISSSNYPRFEVNPNTGADYPAADNSDVRIANNAVHLDKSRPSVLILPVRGN